MSSSYSLSPTDGAAGVVEVDDVYQRGGGGGVLRVDAAPVPAWKRAHLYYEAKDASLTSYFDHRPWATRLLVAFVVLLSLVCAGLMLFVITSDYGGTSLASNRTSTNASSHLLEV
jgi:hypothetical protein